MKLKYYIFQFVALMTLYVTHVTQTSWSFFDDLIDGWNPSSRYCQGGECWVQQWIDLVWTWIDGIETSRTFSQYVQDIAIYVLWFVSLVAVLYIIYAGFRILIWNWDEEQLKKSKSIIIYVIIWLVVMWLAWSITTFVLDIFQA